MGTSISALMAQTGMMFMLMLLGFGLFRRKMVDAHGVSQMADVVMYVSTPALTVQALRAEDGKVPNVEDILFCGLATLVIMCAAALLSTAVFRKPESGLARYGVIFSNSGFIGIPIVRNVLGDEYVFLLMVCNFVYTMLLWTYGIWLVSGDASNIAPLRILLNPAVFSMGIGLLIFIADFELPIAVSSAFNALGDMNTGLIMIVLGAYIAQVDPSKLIRNRAVYLVSALRLVAVPLVSLILLSSCPFIGIAVRETVLIAMATPVASLAAVFSKKFGDGSDFGIGLVAMSTLLSLATMPVMLCLADALF